MKVSNKLVLLFVVILIAAFSLLWLSRNDGGGDFSVSPVEQKLPVLTTQVVEVQDELEPAARADSIGLQEDITLKITKIANDSEGGLYSEELPSLIQDSRDIDEIIVGIIRLSESPRLISAALNLLTYRQYTRDDAKDAVVNYLLDVEETTWGVEEDKDVTHSILVSIDYLKHFKNADLEAVVTPWLDSGSDRIVLSSVRVLSGLKTESSRDKIQSVLDSKVLNYEEYITSGGEPDRHSEEVIFLIRKALSQP